MALHSSQNFITCAQPHHSLYVQHFSRRPWTNNKDDMVPAHRNLKLSLRDETSENETSLFLANAFNTGSGSTGGNLEA